jgi:hypothetical protein
MPKPAGPGCSPIRARKWRRQRRNIDRPLAQRRQHGRSTGEQRLSNSGRNNPACNHVFQRQVAGGDQPHIDPEAVARADRANIAAL